MTLLFTSPDLCLHEDANVWSDNAFEPMREVGGWLQVFPLRYLSTATNPIRGEKLAVATVPLEEQEANFRIFALSSCASRQIADDANYLRSEFPTFRVSPFISKYITRH